MAAAAAANNSTKRTLQALAKLVVFICLVITAQVSVAADTLPLIYSGRLVDKTGAPLKGRMNMSVSFWNAAKEGSQLGEVLTFEDVPLIKGMFTISLELTGAKISEVFGDGTQPVHIELTAGEKVYPRQLYSYVPLALRIPVDTKTLAFDNDGRLGLAVTAQPTENQFLTKDNKGALIWGTATVASATKLQGQGIATSKPLTGQILTYDGQNWTPTAPDNINGAGTAIIPVQRGGTGLTAVPSYGELLIGNGQGYSLNTLMAGPTEGVMISNGTGSITLDTVQDIRTSASPSFSGLTILTLQNQLLKADGTGHLAGASASDITGTLGFTPVNLAGDTMLGPLAIPRLIQFGTSAPALSTNGNGSIYFDQTSGQFKVSQNGSIYTPLVTGGSLTRIATGTGLIGGPITVSGTISLANTSVTAGSYTRADITVDAQGRVTAAANGGNINLATDATGILQVPNGGTGAASFTNNGVILGNNSGNLLSTAAGLPDQMLRIPPTGSMPSFGAIDVSKSAAVTGTLPLSNGGTGADLSTSGGPGQYLKQSTVGGVITVGSISSAEVTSALGYTPVNKSGDTMSGTLNLGTNNLNSVGAIVMSPAKTLMLSNNSTDPSGLIAADSGKTWFDTASKKIKYWDGSITRAVGLDGAGVTSLNGLTANSQSFSVPGTTGLAPNWTSAVSTHTLNIPMASGTGVTAGLLSNADYASLNSRLSSVVAGTGISVNTINTTATISLATIGSVGTYTKVSIDSYGRAVSGATLLPSDIPPHSAALITSGTLNTVNGGTGLSAVGSANQIMGANAAGSGLEYKTVAGTVNQVSVTNSAGTITLSTPQSINTTSSPTFAGMALSANLDVSSTITERGIFSPAVSSAGQGRIYFDATSNDFRISQNGGAYTPLATGGTVTTVSAGSGLTGGPITTTGSLSLATVGTAGTYSKVITDTYGRVTGATSLIAADLPPHSAALITSGTLNTANGGTGLSAVGSANQIMGANAASSALEYKTVAGTANQIAVTNSAGTITLSAPQSINTTSSPTFAGMALNSNLDVSGAITERGMAAPTLSSTGQGRIYFDSTTNDFRISQNGGAYSPLSTGGTVTTVTAGNGLTGGPITTTGSLSLAAVGTAGTYSKVITDTYGRVAGSTSLIATDLPPHSAALITSGTLNTANGGTGLSTVGSANQIVGANAAGSALEYKTVAGTANQISVANSAGTITLSTPQSINTTSSPTFAGMALSANLDVSSTITERGIFSPAVSSGGQGRIYFDATSNDFRISQNGGAYTPLATGGTVTTVTAGSGLTGGPITTTGSLSLATIGTAGTYSKVVTDVYGRVTGSTTLVAADLPPISASTITTGTLAVANGGTGVAAFTNNGVLIGSGSSALSATASGAQYNVLTVNATNAPVFGQLNLSSTAAVSGTLATANGGTGLPTIGSANQIMGTNAGGSALEYKTVAGTANQIAVTNSAGTITLSTPQSINTTSSPTFAGMALNSNLDVSGAITERGMTAPTLSSAGQGRIYFDSTTNDFRISQNGGAYAPLATGGTVTTVTAGNGLTGGPITTTGSLSLATIGTAGTYSKVITDVYGRVAGSASLIAADLPPHSAALITTGTLNTVNGGTGLVTIGSANQIMGANAGGSGLEYKTVAGTTNQIAVTNSAGTITLSTPQSINTTSSPTFAGMALNGNLGVGNTAPSSMLDVSGAITERGMAAPTLSSTGQGRIYFDSTTNDFRISQNGGAYSPLSTGGTVTTVTAGNGLTGGPITTTGSLSLAAVGTAGNYSKVITDTYGRVTGSTSLIAADLPPHSAALITSGTLNTVNGGTGLSTVGSANQIVGANAAGSALEYKTVAGTANQIDVVNSAGTITLSTPQSINTTSSPTFAGMGLNGNLGVGNTAPSSMLDVSGAITERGMAVPTLSSAGQGRIYFDSTTNDFRISQNGGAYSPLSTGGTVTTVTAGNGLTGGPITTTGSLSLAAVGTAGTYSKVITDTYGRVTGSTSLIATDLPPHSAALITSGTLNTANGGTGLVTIGSANQIMGANAAGSALEYKTVAGTTNQIAVTNSAGTITLSTPQSINTTSSPTFAGMALNGNLGVGNTAPSSMLDVSGAITERGMAPPTLSSAGQGRLYFDSTTNDFRISQNGGAYAPLATGGTVTTVTAGNGLTGGPITTTGSLSLATVGTAGTYSKVVTDVYGRVTGSTSLIAADLPPHSAALITSGTLNTANGGTGLVTIGSANQIMGANAAGSALEYKTVAGTANQISVANSAGTISLSIASVGTSGTYSKVITDAYGRVTGSTTLVADDLPPISASNITTGTLPVANGGTGVSAFTNNGVLIGSGSSALSATASGAQYNVLTVNATNAPVFGQLNLSSTAAVSGTLATANGGTGLPTIGSANQIMGANAAGSALEYKTVAGTTNQINVANSAGTITLSTPQSINTTSSPTFAAMAVSGNLGIGTITPGTKLDIGANATPLGGVIADYANAQFRISGTTDATKRTVLGFDTTNNYGMIGAVNNSTAAVLAINPAGGNVGIGTISPSAILDLNSTTSGFLPPRLTTAQRNGIASPSVGLTIYNTTSNLMEMYNGVGWVLVGQIMPEGAIMAFASTSCPAGWAEYSEAYGRFMRGIDKSGTSIDLGGQRAPGNIQDQDWKGFSMTNTGQNYYGYSHGPVDMGKSTSTYTGNLFTGYWSAPAAGVGTKWNTNDEVRPKNVAVLYCRYSGGSGVSVPASANQVIQNNSSMTVTDSGLNGAIALATEGADRLNILANGNVGIGTTNPGIGLDINAYVARKMWRAKGNGPHDAGDNNYVSGRSLSFSKYKASSSLRVGYNDNFRVLAGACQWELRIDGASCGSGKLNLTNYSDTANHHRNDAFFGYCDNVAAGSHTLAVYVGNVSGMGYYDCYTGWDNQSWTLEVEEVN